MFVTRWRVRCNTSLRWLNIYNLYIDWPQTLISLRGRTCKNILQYGTCVLNPTDTYIAILCHFVFKSGITQLERLANGSLLRISWVWLTFNINCHVTLMSVGTWDINFYQLISHCRYHLKSADTPWLVTSHYISWYQLRHYLTSAELTWYKMMSPAWDISQYLLNKFCFHV